MGDLFQELKRRKVFQVAAVYAVVAWLLIQVADTVLPALQMPDWTVSFVTVLFFLGFPIAVILAWAYELTPQGLRTESDSSPRVVQEQEVKKEATPTEAPCVVVMPFRARDSEEIEQLTAEGLTDDITTLLTLVKDIRVVPRQAVARRLDPNDDPLGIAHELGGSYAVTGSVRRSGDMLRVSTELTDLSDKKQTWSQKFDREASDIFAIQDEIAKGVVGAIGGVISRVEGARALRQPPENLRAWELTRRALAVAWDWRPETLHQGMLDARKAIELDPNYAQAHAVLALILPWRAVSGWTDNPEQERLEGLREADIASRLGYDNAEALWPVMNCYVWAGEPQRTVELYERSIARQPDIFLAAPFALAHASLGYAKIGREEEGLALLKKFQDTFPNDEYGSVWTRVMVGYIELCRRNYSLVADVLAHTASEHDGMCRVIALMNSGQEQEAIAEFNRWKTANPAIKLDHYTEYFKGFHIDKSVGAELSDALSRLKQLLG